MTMAMYLLMPMSSANFKSSFLSPSTSVLDNNTNSGHGVFRGKKKHLRCEMSQDWKLSNGKQRKWIRRRSLSDDSARRVIKQKAIWESQLRKNQGCQAKGPNGKWLKRTPAQMAQYLTDDRHGHKYRKHVVAAIKIVRQLASQPQGSYNIRHVMSSFIGCLSFREMCIVLKEQRGWQQARVFFAWMKLQLCYTPSVIAYTIVLRTYGRAGKLSLVEETFMEMLEIGCEPDEVACSTMICAYARRGRHEDMLLFYSAVCERSILPSVIVHNIVIASLHKASMYGAAIQLYEDMSMAGLKPNHFTYTLIINLYSKEGETEKALKMFQEMKGLGLVPYEITYNIVMITYNIVINMIGRQGKQEDALRLFDDMRLHSIVPSNYTCASLLNLCSKNGDCQYALSIFSEMERNGIAMDEVISCILIKIYGKLGLYEDAEITFKELEQTGLLTHEKTYVAMAQVYMKAGDYERALNVLEDWEPLQRIDLNEFERPITMDIPLPLTNIDGACTALEKDMGLGTKEITQLKSTLKSLANELQLWNIGYIRLIKICKMEDCENLSAGNASYEWVPLSLEFGIPLFSPDLCRTICEKVISSQLLQANSFSEHPEAMKKLRKRLREFCAEYHATGPVSKLVYLREQSKDASPLLTNYPSGRWSPFVEPSVHSTPGTPSEYQQAKHFDRQRRRSEILSFDGDILRSYALTPVYQPATRLVEENASSMVDSMSETKTDSSDDSDSNDVILPGVNLLFDGSWLHPFDIGTCLQGRLPVSLIAEASTASASLQTRS